MYEANRRVTENMQQVVLEVSKETTKCRIANAAKLKIDGLEGRINQIRYKLNRDHENVNSSLSATRQELRATKEELKDVTSNL